MARRKAGRNEFALHWKRFLPAAVDALLANLAAITGLLLCFDGRPPGEFLRLYALAAPVHTLSVLFAVRLWETGSAVWRQAAVPSALSLLQALGAVYALLFLVNAPLRAFPGRVIALSFVVSLGLIGGSRILRGLQRAARLHDERRSGRRVLIAGAGPVGAQVAWEMGRSRKGRSRPIGFVDDEPSKQGRRIQGLEVLGRAGDLPRLIREERVDEIIVSEPSAASGFIRGIWDCARAAGIHVRVVPPVAEFVEARSALRQVRELSVEDLLARDPVAIDRERVARLLTGKRVLVTGAGGSMGSGLCRQVALFRPARLVALDHDATRLTNLGAGLSRTNPTLDLVLILGDIKDDVGMRELMRLQKPQVILHAAAYWDISLLEERPREAIRNNVHGTLNVARAAHISGVEAFVLISTNEAAYPTNVMGASKRVCELVGQALNHPRDDERGTVFTAVRLGNLLRSETGVLQAFRRQIAAGGPVTVPHPRSRRRINTVAEGSQLVLQAASFGPPGDVFLLGAGEPVRVLDIARELIRLSGAEPGRDISIVFTGPRPGERLEDDATIVGGPVRETSHPKLFRCPSASHSGRDLLKEVEELISASESEPVERLRKRLQGLVPEFVPGAKLPPAPQRGPKGIAAFGAGQGRNDGDGGRDGIRLVDRVVAAWMVGTMGLPLGIAMGLRRRLGPRDLHLVREVALGRDRRVGTRRARGGWAPIAGPLDERGRRNLGETPYAAYRIKFRGVPRNAFWRRADGLLRALGSEAFPGLVRALRGEGSVWDRDRPRPGRRSRDHVVCGVRHSPAATDRYTKTLGECPGERDDDRVMGAARR